MPEHLEAVVALLHRDLTRDVVVLVVEERFGAALTAMAPAGPEPTDAQWRETQAAFALTGRLDAIRDRRYAQRPDGSLELAVDERLRPDPYS